MKDIADISDLQPDSKNANRGTERGLAILEDSLRKYGAGRSILVDKDGVVIAGNKTLEQAADLDIPIRIVRTDGRELVVVQREDLDLGDSDGRARELAYADNRSSQVGLDWDLERILADVNEGVNLSGLWSEKELRKLFTGIAETETRGSGGNEYRPLFELGPWDVPDARWPSDNEWDIPSLDAEMQAAALDMPAYLWGATRRTAGMKGTWVFYCDDYRFEALWKDPSGVVNTGCAAVIEPNFTVGPQTPRAVAIWQIYRKRWLARWWQSRGIKIIVDMNLDTEAFSDLMLLGVPQGWKAYGTRGYVSRMAATIAEYELACEHAGTDDILFVLYGGGQQCRVLAAERGWLYLSEHMDLMESGEVSNG